jgi:hypothetical protein
MMMRNRLMIAAYSLLIGALMSVSCTSSASAQSSGRGQQDLPFKEEIRRSFQLAQGAEISVSTISGPVDVKTSGGNTTEVYIVRSAETQRDLECYRTVIEQTGSGLSIRHSQDCRNVRAHQRVELSVPRDVNLRLDTISGDVHIGDIGGQIKLSSISGDIWIEQSNGDVKLSSISGQVNLNIARLDRDIRMDSISGRIVLHFAAGVNADVSVSSISGHFASDIPGVTVEKVGDSDYRAQVGRGGPEISISSVSGRVTLQ